MRLIQANPNWQVQSLGREDISAPIRVAAAEGRAAIAKGQAIKGLADTVADISMDIYQRDENEKVGDYYATAIKSMQDTKAFLNRDTIPVGEIPDGVNYNKTAPVTMDDGSVVMEERTAVPVHEISEQIFQRNIDTIHKTGKETLSKRGYEAFYGKFTPTELSNRGAILNNNAKAKYNQQRERAIQSAESLFYSGNAEAGKEIINNSEVFTVQEKQDAIENMEIKTELRDMESLMEVGNPVDMRKQADLLVSQDYEGPLDLKQRNTLAKQLVTRADTLQAELIAAQAKAKAKAVSDYELLIDQGGGSPQRLTEMADGGMISWKDRTRLTKMWYDRQASAKSDAIDTSLVLYHLDNGIPMSPSYKDDRRKVNAYYEQIKNDPAEVLRVTKESTIVPEGLQRDLDIGARHPDTRELAKSATLYSRLRSEIVGFSEQIDPVTREILSSVSLLTENGLSPEAARERVIQSLELSEEERKSLYGQYIAEFDSEALMDELQDMADDSEQFGGEDEYFSWSWAEDVSPLMAAYKELRWRYYLNTRSHEVSKQAAFRDLSSVWSKTSVNAKVNDEVLKLDQPDQLMHHSIERTYSSYTPEEIEQAIQNFADEENISRDRMLIKADRETSVSKPEDRTWAITILDDYGFPVRTHSRRLSLDLSPMRAERERKMKKRELDKAYEWEEDFERAGRILRTMPGEL